MAVSRVRAVQVPWDSQPQEVCGINRASPIGGVLDRLWLGNQLDGRCIISGQSAAAPAAATRAVRPQGVAASAATSAAATTTIPALNKFPIVVFGFGYFSSTAGAWSLNHFNSSETGYIVRIAAASPTTVGLTVRFNYGTQRDIAITLPAITDVPICMAAQIFSDTDYRLYCNGQMVTGTLSCGTLGAGLNQMSTLAGDIAGGQFAMGHGIGRSVTDDYMLELTRNHANVWAELIEPQQIYLPVAITATAYAPGTEAALGGWTPSTGATLAPCIWEAIADDAAWIEGDVGTSTPLFPWRLNGVVTPLPAGNWDVPVRALKVNTTGQIRSVLVDSGGTPVAGGTGIWHALTGGYATYTDNLTIASAASHVRYETQA